MARQKRAHEERRSGRLACHLSWRSVGDAVYIQVSGRSKARDAYYVVYFQCKEAGKRVRGRGSCVVGPQERPRLPPAIDFRVGASRQRQTDGASDFESGEVLLAAS